MDIEMREPGVPGSRSIRALAAMRLGLAGAYSISFGVHS
jgi:hypothetical protein